MGWLQVPWSSPTSAYPSNPLAALLEPRCLSHVINYIGKNTDRKQLWLKMSFAAAMYGLPAGPSIIKVYISIYIYIYVTLHYLYTIHQCGRRPCIVGKTLGTQAKFEVLRSDYTRNFATYSRNRTNIKTTSTDAMSYATRPRMSRIETSAANVVADTTNIKIIAKNQRCGCVSCRYILLRI